MELKAIEDTARANDLVQTLRLTEEYIKGIFNEIHVAKQGKLDVLSKQVRFLPLSLSSIPPAFKAGVFSSESFACPRSPSLFPSSGEEDVGGREAEVMSW